MWKRFEKILHQITILARGQPGQVLILLGLIAVLAGCYTVLKHPSVVDEERALAQGNDSTGVGTQEVTCTDCHNNEYDHRYGSHRDWGWGGWGSYYSGFYPFGYNNYSYNPWRHYYGDPWWSGWGWGGYYDPYPYYPGNPPGGGTPGAPPLERGSRGRGLQSSPPPAPPPTYNPPPPNQEQEQQENQQQNNNNQNNQKRGRRGRG